MPPTFVVMGSLWEGAGQITPEIFATERQAMERAAQLIDRYGQHIVVDVRIEDLSGPLIPLPE